jgi:anaerobic magnesium-protoporphyrin IX monomethyl ester cyclase
MVSTDVLFIHVNLLASIDSPDTIPISEAFILAHLKSRGFSGEILGDFADARLMPGVLAKTLQEKQPVALGFTAYQENMEQIRLWARFAKKIAPDIKVILGGPQVTFMPGGALHHMPEVDFLCRGEGEDVMLGLTQALAAGTDFGKVSGLCFLRNGRIMETGFVRGAKDLDTYASPYLADLIDLRYKDRVILLTSRGCAYGCAFCYTPKASGKTVRFFSTERIVQEMKYLKSKGITAFWFADTNFSVSRKRLVSFLEAIIREVPGIRFWCQTRYDLISDELLALLKRAGAESLAYGLESANPSVLERIHKPIDLQRLSDVIRMTQAAGIHVELFSMFGLPGETFGQALNTLAFVKENDVSVNGNSISQQAHLFFGTPMDEDPERYGIYPSKKTRPAYLSVCRDYETETMSAEQIRRISLIWRLNRDDFAEDVLTGKNLFHRAAFIARHRNALADRPEATCLLARIYLALEEYGAAVDGMRLLAARFGEDKMVAEFLQGPFRCFKTCTGSARQNFKLIYDCQGSVDGRVVPSTYGRYQEAVLGQGVLLPEFEAHLLGVAAGDFREFDITFPADYGMPGLAGRKATFGVYVRHVMEPVIITAYSELERDAPGNQFGMDDLEALRQHNVHVYYVTVNGAISRGFVPSMPDALMLINLYLRLGFVDKAMAVVGRLPQNPIALNRVAYVFQINHQPEKALRYLQKGAREGQSERLIRAKALFDLNRLQEAEAVSGGINMPGDVGLAELRVQLSERLALPVAAYLERQEALLNARTNAML